MTLFRYSILAVTFAAALGAAGAGHAADPKDDDDRPGVRRCTNDPDMASDLYEYLEKCPAAQGVLNQAGQWEAIRATGPASTMGTPSAPSSTGGSMGTPSAPGGPAPDAPSGD